MPLTLLLVDDDALDREAVRRTLRAASVDAVVVEAHTADVAFAQLRTGAFDCILLDFYLPGTDGLSVLRRLKDEGVRVPVIALTGQGDEQTAVDLMKAGAADYLSKQSLSSDRLERSLRHALMVAAAERERDELLAREQAARQEAQAANLAKDEFLATLSHELRTPLNAILGWSHLLGSGTADAASFRRGIETIRRNALLQVKLIDDLLDISRIVSGKLTVDRHPVSLTAIVTTAVESQLPAAERAGVELRFSTAGLERQVLGDHARLQQVVTNLLSNAVKFTPAGGSVSVGLTFDEQQAVLAVADSGIGIDPAFLPHVFERFRQADATSTRSHSGLGLGLAIVKHLVQLHGGSVAAESGGRGAGAVFRVLLPTADQVAGERPEKGSHEPNLAGLSVLVVDDDDDSRELISALLRRSGAIVRTAASARDALAVARAGAPDVLLSDIAMPEDDGYRLIRDLQALDPERPVFAAAITAYATPIDRDRALAAGFREHVAKPFDLGELVATVWRLGQLRSAAAGVE